MKKYGILRLFLLLILIAVTPIVSSLPSDGAAAPKLNVTKRTMNQPGDTYTLTVKNKGRNWKYKWSSSNSKIAKVNQYGLVTAVKKGTAIVRCKITYPNRKTKTLACKITVNLPATAVSISNVKLSGNNTHRVQLGDTYDFNRKLTPSNSTDKTYWVLEDESIAVINTKGILTPKKEGVTRLTAVTARSKSYIKSSKVTAAVLISVVKKSGSIVSIEPVDSSQIKVTFSDPVKADTVIQEKDKLTDRFSIVATRDQSGKMAASYGDLTAELSTDKKVLTITASIAFSGTYTFEMKSGAATESGMLIEEYSGTVKFEDNGKPVYKSSSIDDTGLVAHILFSEPINITSLGITRLNRTDNVAVSSVTESALINTSNYKLSKDKKTILLDMSGIAIGDRNKSIQIHLSGIKDLTGNVTEPNPVVVFVQTDTTTKPQAQLVNVSRTAYNKITAYFSRGLKSAGTMTVGSQKMDGVLDEDDKKIVHYTLTPIAMSYTGTQSLMFANWTSYNVPVGESNPYKYYSFNMTYSASSGPELANYNFESGLQGGVEFNRLTLTYDKNVSTDSYGTINTNIYNESGSVIGVVNLSYTATVKDNVVTMNIENSYMQQQGRYRLLLPVGFARDESYQPSKQTEININKTKTSSTQLPDPTSVTQSSTNPGEVFVEFGNKLDPQSAQYASNYSIPGTIVTTAELVMNTDYRATVKLTIMPGTIAESKEYVIYVSGVSGYDNSYGPIDGYRRVIYLRENVPPVLKSARLTNSTTIVLEYDEQLAGTPSFNVFQGDSSIGLSAYNPIYISGNLVYINLSVSLYTTNNLYIIPRGDCVIKDHLGNKLELSTATPINITN